MKEFVQFFKDEEDGAKVELLRVVSPHMNSKAMAKAISQAHRQILVSRRPRRRPRRMLAGRILADAQWTSRSNLTLSALPCIEAVIERSEARDSCCCPDSYFFLSQPKHVRRNVPVVDEHEHIRSREVPESPKGSVARIGAGRGVC
jgi:hypothetical protein